MRIIYEIISMITYINELFITISNQFVIKIYIYIYIYTYIYLYKINNDY